nr:response regulator [Rhizobium sp. L9]
MLERILKREGFTALISTTAPREALRLFREHSVDLVLLDLMMPDLDGFALPETFARLVPEDSCSRSWCWLPMRPCRRVARAFPRRKGFPDQALRGDRGSAADLQPARNSHPDAGTHGLATPKSDRPRDD